MAWSGSGSMRSPTSCGHKYLTVVVNHDTGRLIWVAPGRDMATLTGFFTALGVERCANVRLVSADAAEWIATVVAEQCPNAVLCADPFHMVAWATTALDEVRRDHWRHARLLGGPQMIRRIKGCRYALLKNPDNLTDHQQITLAKVASVNKTLYRAYLLKEQFRLIFQLRGQPAIAALNDWIHSSTSPNASRNTAPRSKQPSPTGYRTP